MSGLHAGSVLLQQGDYYGQTVNVASRIGEYARPGEVLVSQAVVDACADAPVSFRAIGPVEFKGAQEAIDLYVAGTTLKAALTSACTLVSRARCRGGNNGR